MNLGTIVRMWRRPLECANCGRRYRRAGRYWIGVDGIGRRFRMEWADIVNIEPSPDIPWRWEPCCRRCDTWLPVRWTPVP